MGCCSGARSRSPEAPRPPQQRAPARVRRFSTRRAGRPQLVLSGISLRECAQEVRPKQRGNAPQRFGPRALYCWDSHCSKTVSAGTARGRSFAASVFPGLVNVRPSFSRGGGRAFHPPPPPPFKRCCNQEVSLAEFVCREVLLFDFLRLDARKKPHWDGTESAWNIKNTSAAVLVNDC